MAEVTVEVIIFHLFDADAVTSRLGSLVGLWTVVVTMMMMVVVRPMHSKLPLIL